jgi:hypothetical protein
MTANGVGVKPVRPLDPQRFERAVTGLALYRARAAVIAQIRADNLKLGQFSSREINEKREAYFAAHMEELRWWGEVWDKNTPLYRAPRAPSSDVCFTPKSGHGSRRS